MNKLIEVHFMKGDPHHQFIEVGEKSVFTNYSLESYGLVFETHHRRIVYPWHSIEYLEEVKPNEREVQ